MSQDLTLTQDQLREYTKRKHSDAQRAELEHMRVPFRVRRDGTLVVLLADLSPEARDTIEAAEPEMMP